MSARRSPDIDADQPLGTNHDEQRRVQADLQKVHSAVISRGVALFVAEMMFFFVPQMVAFVVHVLLQGPCAEEIAPT